MEDTSGEWEIVDYLCVEDEKEMEEKHSNLGWALRTGVSIGKKLVVTGVVVSSLPIVLPPLLVISALGVAFSLPFGFVFASYACTEKVMSKLLPAPPAVLPHEEEEEEEEEGRVMDIEEEEKEQRETMKDEIEMRIELDGGGGVQDDIRAVGKESNILDSPEVDAKTTNTAHDPALMTIGLAKSDDKEIVIGSLDANCDEGLSGEDVIAVVPISERQTDSALVNEDVIAVVPVSEVQTTVVVKNEDAIAVVPVSEVQTDTVVENEDAKDVESRKEKEQMSVLEEVSKRTDEDKKRGKRGKRGKRKEPEGEKREDERKEKETLSLEETSTNDLVVQGGLGVADNKRSPEVVGGEGSVGVLSGEKEDRVGNTLGSKLEGEEQKPVDFRSTSQDRRVEGGFAPDLHGEMYGQGSMSSDVLARGTTEDKSDIMVSDDGKTSMQFAAITGSPGLEQSERMHSLKEEEDASAVDSALHSHEDSIWKEIDAIRVIVGFGAPNRSSYFEELKALYLFTGIEPPSSFTDPSDLAEFHNKLRFLKSVIGLR